MKPPVTLVDIYRNALDLMRDGEAWTQGAYARDASNYGLQTPYSDGACKFCMSGAIIKATAALTPQYGVAQLAISYLEEHVLGVPDRGLAEWNDHPLRTWREVKSMMLQACVEAAA
jgi:hypothetical protein